MVWAMVIYRWNVINRVSKDPRWELVWVILRCVVGFGVLGAGCWIAVEMIKTW